MENTQTVTTSGSSAPTASSPVGSSGSDGSAAPAAQETQTQSITLDTTAAEREQFIPRPRFDEVNTRMSAAEKALAEYRERHGWAESVDRKHLEEMASWYSRYNGDAGEFVESILQESLAHPVHGASVKSRLGRMLASLKAQQAEEKIEAGIPVMDGSGQIVARTYTDAQIDQLLEQKLAARFGKELTPFKQDLESRKKADEQRQTEERITKESTRIKTAILKQPGAEQHWAAIQAKARELVSQDADLTAGEAVRDAYLAVVGPTLSSTAKADVLSDLKQKAAAQTIQPGQPTGTAKPKFKSHREALEYYEAHPEEAQAMANR